MSGRSAVLLFGLVNATLFCALQPLWEGFDEPFHYGYIETLRQSGRLPVLGHTMLPADVFASFPLTPMSHAVHQFIPESITYDEWFALSPAERATRRAEADALRPDTRSSARPNYEAHQTPLAYILLAPVDWLTSRLPLRQRVLVLRLLLAWSTVLLLFWGASDLCRTLELSEPYRSAVLFTMFCSEMLYATTAHVANDSLAVALGAPFLAALVEVARRADRRSFLKMSGWLAAGLLAKAYFLAFLLLAAGVTGVLLWRRRTVWRAAIPGAVLVLLTAGPWYVRNMALYGNLAGTHEAFDGIGLHQTIAAAPQVDWPAAAGFLARSSLWMGNNSFGSFSRGTLNAMLALLAVAMVAWVWRRRRDEWVLAAAVAIFSVAMVYATCVAFADRHGTVQAAPPWYTQILLAPVLVLAYAGLSRWRRIGAALAILNVLLWGWVQAATWLVKLFPLYSGGGSAPMRLRDVWVWWTHPAAAHAADLSATAMAPAWCLYTGMAASLTLAVWGCASLATRLARDVRGAVQ